MSHRPSTVSHRPEESLQADRPIGRSIGAPVRKTGPARDGWHRPPINGRVQGRTADREARGPRIGPHILESSWRRSAPRAQRSAARPAIRGATPTLNAEPSRTAADPSMGLVRRGPTPRRAAADPLYPQSSPVLFPFRGRPFLADALARFQGRFSPREDEAPAEPAGRSGPWVGSAGASPWRGEKLVLTGLRVYPGFVALSGRL
jgi:hypothetical protein